MPGSSPTSRLAQVVRSFVPGLEPTGPRIEPSTAHPFRPLLPAGLAVNHTPLNPINFLLRAAIIFPDHLAIIHPERNVKVTYREWAWRVSDLAHALLARGIKSGDRVAVIAPNTPVILDLEQAVSAIGAVVVPLNTRNTAAEIEYVLGHSGSKLVLADSAYAELCKGAKCPVVVADDSRPAGDEYEEMLREGRKAGQGLGFANIVLPADEQAPYSLCYTSGTTGRPKGCLSTLRGTYLAALANVIESKMDRSSVYLHILPAFHAVGWTFPLAITAAMCTQVCLRAVDNTQIWHALNHLGVTHYNAAPTVQLGIVAHKDARPLPRTVITNIAGSAPTAILIKRLDKLNIHTTHVYGLTETYGPFARKNDEFDPSIYSEDELYARKAMQGHGFLTSDEMIVVRVAKEGEAPLSGPLQEVAQDGKEVGEICTRGNITMQEYYNDPAATAKAFAGGWFHTGDLAVQYPDGTVSIQDRSKDIIISGGENASSLAIESALATHPDVFEVAVVARPHERFGERAHAFVVLVPDSSFHSRRHEFEAELKAHARTRLPGFARPEWVEVLESFDAVKTSTGKLQKESTGARRRAS